MNVDIPDWAVIKYNPYLGDALRVRRVALALA